MECLLALLRRARRAKRVSIDSLHLLVELIA
jgi:hypothetical protein